VGRAFGDHNVFKGVSFEVSAGDKLVILGASGSGKTTLLNMIAGLDKDYTGEIDIPGIKGMMFQEDRLLEDMSPAENVMIADPQLTEEEAVNALRYLLPEDALHKPVKELSGGEKRRVAAVRAMEHKADFYLLDEPFTGLDVKACEDMVKYIDRKRGMAAVIITAHDEEDLPEAWQQELKMFRL
jgi:NitT/TauT family transport system ATP-binding protein